MLGSLLERVGHGNQKMCKRMFGKSCCVQHSFAGYAEIRALFSDVVEYRKVKEILGAS
jgi:hypothetical protein